MRIDRVELRNFKAFGERSFDLHPHFTLLVGENGTGKTSVLDALAVSMAIWLVKPPDTGLLGSRRNILDNEIRLEPSIKGDRTLFTQRLPARVSAIGRIAEREGVTWTRQVRDGGVRTTNAEAKQALEVVADCYRRDSDGEVVLAPVLAYYGAGRAWLPSNERRQTKTKTAAPARRWAAFYDCLGERIRFDELKGWAERETTAAGARGGRLRPGFEVVKRAVLRCVPDADGLWFDPDLQQTVLSIKGSAQPFANLSAGQRMMMALVADIAVKAVTQNAHLLPPDDLGPDDAVLPRLLRETPGMVLIDELDVHLHPRWQRRVATDLKSTFPAIQFVCTSHSPQVVGEVKPEEIRQLDENVVSTPARSYGLDSSRVLEEVMGAKERDPDVAAELGRLFKLIDEEQFADARTILSAVEAKLGQDDPEVTRARALMSFLEDTR